MITQSIYGDNESPRKSRNKSSGFRAGILALSALLLTLAGSIAGAQQTVSVNFVGGHTGAFPANMDPTETAGVLPVANWNQAAGNNGTASALVDSTGAATPFAVTWKSPNTWSNGIADAPGNVRLLKGYLDTGGNGSNPANTSFTVSGLSAANTYSIYVYATGANTGRSGTYSIGTQTFYLQDNGVADGSSFTAGDLHYRHCAHSGELRHLHRLRTNDVHGDRHARRCRRRRFPLAHERLPDHSSSAAACRSHRACGDQRGQHRVPDMERGIGSREL